MAQDLGSIQGQIDLDVRNALGAYTQLRQYHLSTISALNQSSATLAQVGNSFMAMGSLIGGAFVAAGVAYGEFERKMDYMGAVSGASAKDMENLGDMVMQLGARTIYTNDQIAEGFTELAKAGVPAEKILGGIGEGITYLGAAADIGLDKAATMMMSVIATWGMAQDEAGRVADVLAGTANASMVEIEDLGVSMKYAGGIAASLGISFDDVSTALGILGQRSIRGSTAGTSLRQIMVGLTGSTNKATKEMERLGIITEDGTNRFFDQSGKAKDLATVMNILRDATDGMSASQKTQSLRTMFNIRAMPSLIALLDAGTDGFNDMAAAIQGASAADVAAARLDNLSGDIEYLSGEIDNLILSLGSLNQGALRNIVQALEDAVAWFNGLSDGAKGIVMNVALATGAIMLLVGALFRTTAAATAFVANMVLIRTSLLQLGGVAVVAKAAMAAIFSPPVVILLIIAAIAALVGGLTFFFTQTQTGQQVWASLVQGFQDFMAGPGAQLLQLLTQVATTVGTFLVGAFEGFLGTMGTVGQGFSTAAGGVGSFLSSGIETIAGILSVIGEVLTNLVMPIVSQVAPIFAEFASAIAGVSTNMTGMAGVADIIAQVLVAVIDMAAQLVVVFIELGVQLLTAVIGMLPTIITGFVTMFTTILTVIVGMLPQIVQALVTGLSAIIQGIVTILPQIIEAVITLVLAIITALVAAIPQLIAAGIQLFTGLLQALTEALPLIIEGLVTAIPLIMEALIGAIPLIIDAGIQLFLGIVEALIIIIPQVITALVEAIPLILNALIEAIPQILDAAIQAFTAIVEAIPEIIPPLIEALIGLIPTIIETVISLIPTLLDAAIQLFMAIVEAIPQIVGDLVPAIIGLIPTIIDTVISLIPQLIDAAVQLFMAIVDAIPQIVDALVSALIDLGTQMINGLVQGIQNMAGAVLEAIGAVVDNAIGWAKDLLGIHSPSRVFRQIGEYLGEGFAQGITSTEDKVKKATKDLVEVTRKAFDDLEKELAKERKALSKANQDIAKARRTGKSYIDDRKNIRKRIADLEAARKKEAEVLRRINIDNGKLVQLSKQRDKIADQLEEAQGRLEDAINTQKTFRDQTEAGIADRGAVTGKRTTGGMIYNLEQQIKDAEEFKKIYESLKKRGLDENSLMDLAKEFASSGDLSSAIALNESSDAELRRINALRKQLEGHAQTIADKLSKDFYQAGVDSAQGIVNGLQSQLSAIDKAAKDIADALTKAVKKALGIKSPSRVFAELGGYTMEGLAKGLNNSESQVKKQLENMASSMTDFYDQVFAARQFELETMMTLKASTQAAANIPKSEDARVLGNLNNLMLKLEKVMGQQGASETNHFGDIVISMRDLESIKTLEDFMDMIKVYKSQKGGRA